MKRSRWPWFLSFTALLVLSVGSAHAGYVRHMNLRQLCESAGLIFRGTVVEATPGTIDVAGGRIPILIYRVRVDESFHGVGESEEVEIRMLDPKAGARAQAGSVPLLAGLPSIDVGQDYLLFVTRPSAANLSTTVGFGQGMFHIRNGNAVVNEMGNLGLFKEMTTSVAASRSLDYQTLAGEIRRLLNAP